MRSPLDVMVSAPCALAAAERALQTDRAAAGDDMRERLALAFDDYFGEVYAPEPGNRIHLIRSGTGTGKTSAMQAYLAADPRTYDWDGRESDEAYPGPIVILLPTYNNISELRAKAEVLGLDGKRPDHVLAAQARARGIIHARDVDAYVAAIADKRLKTVIYKGKLAAGCKRPSELQALMAAGLPSSRLCRTGGLRCPYFATCGAMTQRKDIVGAHVVYLPRSFLDLQIPEELGKVRAVIADESVWSLLVHSETFPLHTITARRDPPGRLPDGETLTAQQMLGQRDEAALCVRAALGEGRDPAQALRDELVEVPGFGKVRGFLAHAARHAATVTGAAAVARANVHPLLTVSSIGAMVGNHRGKDIETEARFWSLVVEGLDNPRERDTRIQLLGRDTDSPMIRISYLTEANWQDTPLLLLDASGDAEITRRVFLGREIVVHDVPTDFNQRVLACIDKRFALRGIVPGPDATPKQLLDAARMLHEIRCVISAIAGVHAYGRVLIGMPKRLRKAVELNWDKPLNVDFGHAGALAGLDFGRQHVAVVSIGRMEVPVSEIDAQTGALTAMDPVPELPIDANGTGIADDGVGIYPNIVTRALRMRDGSDALYQCHEHAGDMAARVQRQHREENIRQLIGRIRSFYREQTVPVYVIGQAIPEDLIVDELCAWDDLVGSGAKMWDVVRQAGGLLSASAMAKAAPSTVTREQSQRWIERLPAHVADGYHGVIVDGWPVGVPGHMDDISFLEGDIDADSIAWSHYSSPAAPEGRPDDEIELRLGDRHARRAAERKLLKAAKDLVQRRGEWRPAGREFRAGTGELEMMKAPLGVWAAMATLRDPWLQGEETAVPVSESRVA